VQLLLRTVLFEQDVNVKGDLGGASAQFAVKHFFALRRIFHTDGRSQLEITLVELAGIFLRPRKNDYV